MCVHLHDRLLPPTQCAQTEGEQATKMSVFKYTRTHIHVTPLSNCFRQAYRSKSIFYYRSTNMYVYTRLTHMCPNVHKNTCVHAYSTDTHTYTHTHICKLLHTIMYRPHMKVDKHKPLQKENLLCCTHRCMFVMCTF